MEENHYTSLEAIMTLVHALDWVSGEHLYNLVYNATPTAEDLAAWYLAASSFLELHIEQYFIK